MIWFNREELACKCGCGQDTVDYELAKILDDIRVHFGKPVKVTSGNRCEKYNAEIGGSKNSQHLKGRAADIQVIGVKPEDVYEYLNRKYPTQYGIGKYSNFTHIDSRSLMARWNNS